MRGERAELFALRHRRAPRLPRDDDGLRDARQRVLLAQRSGCCKKRTDARHDVVGDALLRHRIHLLLDGPIDGGVARVQAHRHLASSLSLRDDCDDFIERHLRRIVDDRILTADREQRRIDERSA